MDAARAGLKEAFRFGRSRRPRVLGVMVTLLLGVGLLSAGLWLFWPWGPARLVQAAVGATWPLVDPSVWSPLEASLALRTQAMILASAILTFLGALLMVGILTGLWLQARAESRFRRALSWAVGAGPAHLRREWLGTAQRASWFALPGVIVIGAAFLSLVGTFPGEPTLDVGLVGAGLIPVTGLLVAAWFRAGRAASVGLTRTVARPSAAPEIVIVFAVAGLTTALLQTQAGQTAPEGSTGEVAIVELGEGDLDAAAKLSQLLSTAVANGTPLAASSPGVSEALGPVALVRTDCGACYIDGVLIPVMVMRARVAAVARDSFPTLGLTIGDGRDFAATDLDGLLVAAVSRSMANKFFEGGRAVGRQLYLDEAGWREVVAIVEDQPAAGRFDHTVYLPLEQVAPSAIEIRSRGPVQSASVLSVDLAELVATAELGRVIAVRTLTELRAGTLWFGRLARGIALLLALVAFMGVWRSARGWALARRYESGLVRALGASRRTAMRASGVAGIKLFAVSSVVGLWLAMFGGVYLGRADTSIPMFDPTVALLVTLWCALAFLTGAVPGLLRDRRLSPGQILAAGAEQASD